MLFHIIGTEVFIAGSLHMRPAGEELPEYLSAALATADDCFFEADLDNIHEPDFAKYPAGDSLERHISPRLFSKVLSLWQEIGATNPLSPLKPWWAGIAISSVLIVRAGNPIEAGIDRQLWNAVKPAGKRPYFLESPDAFRVFDTAPLEEQIAGLEFLVSDPNQPIATFNRLHAAWRAWDTSALTIELQKHIQLRPITFRGLVLDRNLQWLPQIIGAIKRRRRALFVVGALHLAGENSLQSLLKAQPYNYDLLPVRP